MKNLFFFLALFISAATFQSCEPDNEIITPSEEVAPELPPKGVFIMPFTGFESVDTPGVVSNEIDFRDNPTYRNWFHAASNVVIWNVVLGVTLALPVGAYLESFNHEPTFIGNGTWQWTYDVQAGSDTYTATLTARFINGEEVEWIMKASKAGGFTDLTWYTGIVSVDLTRADWTVYHQPENPEPYMSIDYDLIPGTEDFVIRYTNILPDGPGNGDYIEYATDANGAFNRAYDVFVQDNLLEIEWNDPTREGRVKNPAFFNDTDYHCWGTDLQDTECE